MAILADAGCWDVLRVLANTIGAVMAAHAVCRDVGMVKRRGSPADCRMAVVAGVAARDMSRVLACCRDTVMAGAAGTDYVAVIDCVNG